LYRDPFKDQPKVDNIPARFQNEGILRKLIFAAYVPEYCLTPAFFYLGRHQWFHTATALQVVFAITSTGFQYVVALDCKKDGSCIDDPLSDDGDRTLSSAKAKDILSGEAETILGVKVKYLHIPRFWLELLPQVPNYIHVQQTAVIAGAASQAWSPQLAQEFARRWNFVPFFGGTIAALGLPGCLTAAVVGSAVIHGISAAVFFSLQQLDEACDAANLLFLSKVLIRKRSDCFKLMYPSSGTSRTAMGLFVKLPMTALKQSYLQLTYDCLNTGELTATFVGILLAWYGIAPILYPAWQYTRIYAEYTWNHIHRVHKHERRHGMHAGEESVCCVIIGDVLALCGFIVGWIILFVVALHAIGIEACPSHDLSILQLCTPPSNGSLCFNSSHS